MSTTTEKPIRKFPPPCWTQDEALALIEAYRERWYALRRGYLRTADWDSVADAVGRSCPGASPAKTSAQCRHKMEKLRQRYRAEKQRSLSYPGRFFSSWFFFENMDAMENGTSPGSNQETADRVNYGNSSRPRTAIDQKLLSLEFNSKNSKKIDGDLNPNPNLGFHHESVDPGGGLRVKSVSDRNSVHLVFRAKNSRKSSPNFDPRVSNLYSSYLDVESDNYGDDGTDFGGGFHLRAPIDGNSVPPGFRAKKVGKNCKNSRGDGVDVGGGVFFETPIDSVPSPGFRAKKFGKSDGKLNPNFDWDEGATNRIDADGELWVKVPGDRNTVPPGLRGKYSGKAERNPNPNIDPRYWNGFSSSSKKSGGGGGAKRGRDPVAEMVSSIKLLGEGFAKMEKMKMEMAREIEKMRMEMEMKRSELLLESQQQIVEAFVKGLFESKKKVKPTVLPDS